jgi:AmiR/NasT family two-component response regulator
VATRGFYIDVTESVHAERERAVSEKLQLIVAHREIIDQAKGMLMMSYQINADAAFGILRWRCGVPATDVEKLCGRIK